jgi:hypothetical protein
VRENAYHPPKGAWYATWLQCLHVGTLLERQREEVNAHRSQFVESQKDKLKEQPKLRQVVALVAKSKLFLGRCMRSLCSDWISESISRIMTCRLQGDPG